MRRGSCVHSAGKARNRQLGAVFFCLEEKWEKLSKNDVKKIEKNIQEEKTVEISVKNLEDEKKSFVIAIYVPEKVFLFTKIFFFIYFKGHCKDEENVAQGKQINCDKEKFVVCDGIRRFWNNLCLGKEKISWRWYQDLMDWFWN